MQKRKLDELTVDLTKLDCKACSRVSLFGQSIMY